MEALEIKSAEKLLKKYKFKKAMKHVDAYKRGNVEVLIVEGLAMITTGARSGTIDDEPSLMPYNVSDFENALKSLNAKD